MSIANWLAGHFGGWVIGLLMGLIGYKLLGRFFTTPQRAKWLQDGAHVVFEKFKAQAEASPNKFDDLGLEFLKDVESWAIEQGKILTEAEKKKAAQVFAARSPTELASLIATRASLSPAKVAGVDLSGKKV